MIPSAAKSNSPSYNAHRNGTAIDGAKAMLADHLYERFGTPDMVIGLHDTILHPAGTQLFASTGGLFTSPPKLNSRL